MGSLTRIFIFIFCVVATQACTLGFDKVNGSGNIVNKEFNISDYNNIQLSGFGDIIYEQRSWETPFLQITVDENILPLLEIKVEDNTLYIRPIDNTNINPSQLKIYTNSLNLNNVGLSGSGKVYLKGEVNSNDMKISINGSGSVASDSLYCERLNLNINGSGKASMEGACNDAEFHIAGSGDIGTYGFQVKNLNCKISGSGIIKSYVHQTLNANIAGSGNIRYKGNPQTVNQSVSGSGNISKEE